MVDVANTCWFVAGSSGVADFADGTALTGMGNLAAKATSTKTYTFRAEHPTDKSIWEEGSGVYNGTTLARTTVTASSTGSKINFLVAPVVLLAPMKRDWDLLAPLNAPAFTGNGSITGTFGVGGDLAVNTNKFNVTASSGAVAMAGALSVTDTTAATSTTTGSGKFGGGIGVAGKGYFGGQLNVTDTTVSSSVSTGSAVFGGGLGVAGEMYVGGGIHLAATKQVAWGNGGIGSGSAVVAPGLNLQNNISIGMVYYRDLTNGGSALVLYDGGSDPVIVSQTIAGLFVLDNADPGPGTNKLVVFRTPNTGVVKNRYSGNVTIFYAAFGASMTLI